MDSDKKGVFDPLEVKNYLSMSQEERETFRKERIGTISQSLLDGDLIRSGNGDLLRRIQVLREKARGGQLTQDDIREDNFTTNEIMRLRDQGVIRKHGEIREQAKNEFEKIYGAGGGRNRLM